MGQENIALQNLLGISVQNPNTAIMAGNLQSLLRLLIDLNTDNVANRSMVPGTTTTDALDYLLANISGGFTPIDYADLLAAVQAGTATNGIFYLENRPNSGTWDMLVLVSNNAVSAISINAVKNSRGSFTVDTQVGGDSGEFNILIDATVLNSAPVAWDEATDTPEQIATAAAAAVDLAGYSAFAVGAVVYINNNDETNGGVVSVATDSGDDLVTTSVNNMATGGVFQWTIEGYDFVNDNPVVICQDTQRNKFTVGLNSSDLYIYFPADNANNINNDMTGGGVCNFTNFTGIISGWNTFNQGVINANGSNADMPFGGSVSLGTLDVSLVVGGAGVYNVNFQGTTNFETLTVPSAGLSDINIDLIAGTSNLSNVFTITANAIDATGHPWTGIIDFQSTGTLNTISNLSSLPKYFTLAPHTGVSITIDPLTATNIKLEAGSPTIVIDGTLSQQMEVWHDGTNVYQRVLSQPRA